MFDKHLFNEIKQLPKLALMKQNKQAPYLLYLIIFASTFLLYGNTIFNSFNLDDLIVIKDNEVIHKGIKGIPEIFTTNYITDKGREVDYRPLVKTTFALEYQLYGENTHLHHFFNVLLFAISVMLLYYLLSLLFKEYHLYLAFFVSLLYLAHPIHTEVVASLKNRDEILSYIFGMLVLIYAYKYVMKNSVSWLFYSGLFFILALLSKISSLVFLAVVPLILYFFTNANLKKIGTTFIFHAGLITAYYIIILSLLPTYTREFYLIENPLIQETLVNKIPTAVYALGYYIQLLILPHPLLSYYGYNQIPIVGWSNVYFLFSLLIYLGLTVYGLHGLKSKNLYSFAILLFLIHISMFSNVILPLAGIVADRALHAASLGFALIVVLLMYKLAGISVKNKRHKGYNYFFLMMFGLLILAYSMKTISRNFDWKDELTLYSNDVKNGKKSAKLHYLYGQELLKQAKMSNVSEKKKTYLNKSIKVLKKAIKIYPRYPSAHSILGQLYAEELKDFENGIKHLSKAVEVNPNLAKAQYNLARCYQSQQQPIKAIKHYKKAVEVAENNVRAWCYLSQLQLAQGNKTAAFSTAQKLATIAPDDYFTHYNYGHLYFNQKDTLKAVQHFEKAIVVNPSKTDIAQFLYQYYQSKGNEKKSQHYRELFE